MIDKLSNPKPPVIRNRYYLIADFVLLPFSVILSALLRFNLSELSNLRISILLVAALALAKPCSFYLLGIYRHHWRYASISELFILAAATVTGELFVVLAFYLLALSMPQFSKLPIAFFLIDWMLSFALTGTLRFIIRLIAERPLSRLFQTNRIQSEEQRRVLVMGAGDAGAMIIREMQANPGLGLVPVGLLDDNRAKIGMVIHDVPVQGTRDDIPRLVQEQDVDEIIIAMPTAPGRAIREVVAICQQANIRYKTIPGIYELISGQVSARQVREVRIEDLLRREPIRLAITEGDNYLTNTTVLVTGAGGSIGSELCRQIARQRPRQLLLLGHGENSIYHIHAELKQKYPHLPLCAFIADIRDEERLQQVFDAYRPTTVFHAAAHKHVPLMETNVAEAVMNNVFGTRCLLHASETHQVQRFVIVSTDKAVNPTNVMGATKRIAELLVQATAQRTGNAYVVVRFGNVLGSRGSVVPLFQRQIAQGGPVTVTHPEMRRYFMTIPEAVQLIIQAATVGHGGDILVLDMGEQLRIVDLASDIIRLSGLEPGRDIEIVFTGPRPGEKLSEALFNSGEKSFPTAHEKILMARDEKPLDYQRFTEQLTVLHQLASEGDPAALRAQIQRIVPNYQITLQKFSAE